MAIKYRKITDPYQKQLTEYSQEKLQQMRDEHYSEIQRLEKEMKQIDEIKDGNTLSKLLDPVIGHWIKIPGRSWFDEDDRDKPKNSVEYRIGHVVRAEEWEGGDQFILVFDRLISVWKNRDYSDLNIDFAAGEELKCHRVKHLGTAKVIPDDKIVGIISKIQAQVTRRFTWFIKKVK